MTKLAENSKQTPQRRFRPYPEYRDSGVEWLRELPAHWEPRRLKTLLCRNDGGVWGDDFDADGTIVLRSTEQTVGGDWRIDQPARRSLSATERVAARLCVGDLVVTKSSGSKLHIGKTTIVTPEVQALDCCFSNFMQRLRCKPTVAPRFVYYILNSPIGREQFVFGSNSTTGLANLNGGMIGNLWLGFPSFDEQQAIVAFLDRETARIDELIAKKQRLIELLAEKRSALISHAADGSISEPYVRLKHFIDLLPGFAFPSSGFSHDDSDIRLLRGANIAPGSVVWDDTVRWPFNDASRYSSFALVPGDIVLGMDRPWISTGIRVAEIMGDDIPSLLLQRVARLRARGGLLQAYLKLLLNSKQFLAYFEPILTGVSVPHISPEQIGGFPFRLPSIESQKVACEHIEGRMREIESLNERVSDGIIRMHELRSALISAAVTGKIDVRSKV